MQKLSISFLNIFGFEESLYWLWNTFWSIIYLQASERLHEKMTNFVSKNKAAQIHGSRLVMYHNRFWYFPEMNSSESNVNPNLE